MQGERGRRRGQDRTGQAGSRAQVCNGGTVLTPYQTILSMVPGGRLAFVARLALILQSQGKTSLFLFLRWKERLDREQAWKENECSPREGQGRLCSEGSPRCVDALKWGRRGARQPHGQEGGREQRRGSFFLTPLLSLTHKHLYF